MGTINKKDRSYSVIIVSDAMSTSKDFVITRRFIQRAIAALSVLLFIFGFMIYDYLTISFDKQRIKRLEAENVSKDNQINKLVGQIESLSSNLDQMETFKSKILVAAGLTSPNALNEVGSGGGIETPMGAQLLTPQQATDSAQQQSIPITERIDSLEKIASKAGKINETLQFVDSFMDKQKVRLASTPTIWPVHGYLTSSFGYRTHPLTGKPDNHSGQDIATQLGSPIVASADGFVLMTAYNQYLGKTVVIDHGFGFQTRYGHMAEYAVKEGDRVKRAQLIGYVGSTGSSTAPHLHYEVIVYNKPQNPMDFILE